MIVVADTSPIRYLVLIEQIDLLPILFDRVIIPPAVDDELKSLGAPIVARKWLAHPPTWLTVETLQNPSIDYVGLDRLHSRRKSGSANRCRSRFEGDRITRNYRDSG
jgi:predicted nucleic acid-binding protein